MDVKEVDAAAAKHGCKDKRETTEERHREGGRRKEVWSGGARIRR